MRRHESRLPYPALALSLTLSLLVVGWGWMALDGFTLHRIGTRLLWPLVRLLLFITLGLVVGQAIEALGWTRRLGVVAAPLFRFSRIGEHCSAAFTTAFFSGAAANAMLLEFLKADKINRRQLVLANLMNQVPAYFLHLPTTFFIVLPLTGQAGALYFLLTFIALAARTTGVVVYGRLFCHAPMGDQLAAAGASRQPNSGGRTADMLASIQKRLPGRVVRIAVYVVPIYVLVFMINVMGGFDVARQWLAQFVVTSVLPVESLSLVILSFAAEFTSGFAAAGALLSAGVLTVKQTVIALLAGNIVAFPIRALRHQLPRYMGIFSPSLGLQLLLLGQGLRVISLVVVGVGYFWLV